MTHKTYPSFRRSCLKATEVNNIYSETSDTKMGLLLPPITFLLILTFFDILLLLEKVLDKLFFLDSLLLLVCLLERFRLGRFLILKHAHVVSETIIQPPERLALPFLYRLGIVKRRPIYING